MLKAIGMPPRNSSTTLAMLTRRQENLKTHLGERKYTIPMTMAI